MFATECNTNAAPAIVLALVALLSTGCRPAGSPTDSTRTPEPERRDLLLITVDTLRHDATGFSGSGKVRTPVLDRLAEGGRVFTWTHAHAVVTLPSHATVLTGLLPHEHGIRDNAGFTLPDDVPTLATVLSSAGYATAAFVSAFPLDRRFGLARGFDVYDDAYESYGANAFTFPERPGHETVARAREWWAAQAGRSRFLWVHIFTPHFPYEPAEPFASEYPGRPYHGDVAMADAELAPLVEPIVGDGAASTLVVVTSDHGEALGEHGEATHGLFAYESTLRVPLLFWGPGLVEPGRDARTAGHADIFASVLALLGVSAPESSGASLFAPTTGNGRALYFEALTAYLNRGWAPLRGRVEGSLKAIDLPLPELYDLEADPAETANLAERRPDALVAMLAELPEDARGPVRRESVDREVVERLRSLGYVSAGGSGSSWPRDFTADDDPKRLVQEEVKLFEAFTDYRAGRAEKAIRTLREMIARRPGTAVAYGHLAFMLTDQGRLAEAAQLLGGALDSGVDTESIRRKLALVLLRRGDADGAWRVLEPHGESEDPETQTALGRIAAMQQRFDEADARIRRALSLDPTFPDARIDHGILLLMQGDVVGAGEDLEAGLEANPFHAEGWNALGALRSRQGELPLAVEAWRRALDVDPRLPDALFNLALVLGRSGDARGAADALRRYIPLVDGEERRRAEAMLRDLTANADP